MKIDIYPAEHAKDFEIYINGELITNVHRVDWRIDAVDGATLAIEFLNPDLTIHVQPSSFDQVVINKI